MDREAHDGVNMPIPLLEHPDRYLARPLGRWKGPMRLLIVDDGRDLATELAAITCVAGLGRRCRP